jgi:hypothetical protein
MSDHLEIYDPEEQGVSIELDDGDIAVVYSNPPLTPALMEEISAKLWIRAQQEIAELESLT